MYSVIPKLELEYSQNQDSLKRMDPMYVSLSNDTAWLMTWFITDGYHGNWKTEVAETSYIGLRKNL